VGFAGFKRQPQRSTGTDQMGLANHGIQTVGAQCLGQWRRWSGIE
jgi:hypothetical protein